MRTDNSEHKTLFSIPSTPFNTEIATTQPLPPQRVITGHHQTDAYLWVLEVIKLNEPAHLPAAEMALQKLTITPQEAEQRYRHWLMAQGHELFIAAFSTLGMDNPQSCIENARRAISKASQVRAHFGSYAAAMEPTEPERRIAQSGFHVDEHYGMTPEEVDSGELEGLRIFEVQDARSMAHRGFCDVLPAPHTLSDVVREFEYWQWFYVMRSAASKALGDRYYDQDQSVCDRERYLEELLTSIKPLSRQEALDVCKWVLANESLNDMGEDTKKIILNLVGECD